VVFFGGVVGASHHGDTWVWDGAAWTQVAETGPSPRGGHAMTGDDRRGVIVLFGGLDDDGATGDTWEWDGTAWTQREETGPAARHSHAMTYDAGARRVLLFGGVSAGEMLDDTWEWDGTQWRQVAEFGPPGGPSAGLAYDGRGTVLFGGIPTDGDGELGQDSTWEWDGRFWTELRQFGPPGRRGHASAFDVDRRRLVIYGGVRDLGAVGADALLRDTWERPGGDPRLAALTVTPAAVRPGEPLAVTVRMSGPTADEVRVELDARSPGGQVVLSLAPFVTVPAGADSGTVTLPNGLPFSAPTGTFTVTATAGGASRSTPLVVNEPAPPGALRIAAALPNPLGADESLTEEVHLRNDGPTVAPLIQWRISNGRGEEWPLDAADGSVAPGQVMIVNRGGRAMSLPNEGATLLLIDPTGAVRDTRTYGPAQAGELVQFP
jgi:hypothetical protein